MNDDVLPMLTAARVLVVAGKGGVGKTTVTATLAAAAGAAGMRVLVVELDGKPVLADLVGGDVSLTTAAEEADAGVVELLAVSAPAALDRYLQEHGFARVAKRLSATGVIEVVSTAAPGIDDIVVLGRIKQLERSGDWDLIVVDGPAAGHAVTMLTAAAGLRDAVRGGPVRAQADEVLALLHDPARCNVVLVTLPETTPVNETIETAYALEDRVGVALGPVVVNAVDTGEPLDISGLDGARVGGTVADREALVSAAEFRNERRAVQAASIERLAATLPLPQVHVPLALEAELTAASVGRLATSLRSPATPQPACAAQTRRSAGAPLAPPREPRDARCARYGGKVVSSLHGVLDGAEVVVCCGPGGVGKTTCAAAIGLEAASRGRRVVVVTIDPARRLADALGLGAGGLGAEPQRVGLDGIGGGAIPGELWAMMLDTTATFTKVVRRNAADPDQAERILANRFFRNMVTSLGGTTEYMAAEALHELHGDERFDLVVVDTPPSRDALDFLEAPGVLTRFLDHRVFRLIMLPAQRGMKLVGWATQPLLRTVGKIVGGDVLADAVAFFQAFGGMEAGFRERATEVTGLLRAPATRYVVVAAPRHEAVTEAAWFAEQLAAQGVAGVSAVVNRIHPAFGDGTAADAHAAPEAGDEATTALWRNVAELRTIREAELLQLEEFVGGFAERDRGGRQSAGRRPAIAEVPLLAGDVHDRVGLAHVARHLFGAPDGSGPDESG